MRHITANKYALRWSAKPPTPPNNFLMLPSSLCDHHGPVDREGGIGWVLKRMADHSNLFIAPPLLKFFSSAAGSRLTCRLIVAVGCDRKSWLRMKSFLSVRCVRTLCTSLWSWPHTILLASLHKGESIFMENSNQLTKSRKVIEVKIILKWKTDRGFMFPLWWWYERLGMRCIPPIVKIQSQSSTAAAQQPPHQIDRCLSNNLSMHVHVEMRLVGRQRDCGRKWGLSLSPHSDYEAPP